MLIVFAQICHKNSIANGDSLSSYIHWRLLSIYDTQGMTNEGKRKRKVIVLINSTAVMFLNTSLSLHQGS